MPPPPLRMQILAGGIASPFYVRHRLAPPAPESTAEDLVILRPKRNTRTCMLTSVLRTYCSNLGMCPINFPRYTLTLQEKGNASSKQKTAVTRDIGRYYPLAILCAHAVGAFNDAQSKRQNTLLGLRSVVLNWESLLSAQNVPHLPLRSCPS